MLRYFSEKFGNPGSLHFSGQEASAALDVSREILAKIFGAEFREIIFTGSATESNNLALRGAVKKARSKHGIGKPRLLVSAIEHEAVLETARDLAREDEAELVVLPVTANGLVNPEDVRKNLTKNTVLVSVMYANNEVGSVQPIGEISRVISEFKGDDGVYPLFHTDAVQAFQYLTMKVGKLGVDLMTVSAHKIYGPKGVGALYVKNQSAGVDPIITGGGQEFGYRSGTENVAGIVGFAKAAEMTEAMKEKEGRRVGALRDRLYGKLKSSIEEIELNGLPLTSPDRLPNNLNIYFSDRSGEELLIACSLEGVAVSAGSACQSRSLEPSHVLLAMYGDRKRASASLRLTLGRGIKSGDIDTAAQAIIKVIERGKK